jgi:hypothetical protein
LIFTFSSLFFLPYTVTFFLPYTVNLNNDTQYYTSAKRVALADWLMAVYWYWWLSSSAVHACCRLLVVPCSFFVNRFQTAARWDVGRPQQPFPYTVPPCRPQTWQCWHCCMRCPTILQSTVPIASHRPKMEITHVFWTQRRQH